MWTLIQVAIDECSQPGLATDTHSLEAEADLARAEIRYIESVREIRAETIDAYARELFLLCRDYSHSIVDILAGICFGLLSKSDEAFRALERAVEKCVRTSTYSFYGPLYKEVVREKFIGDPPSSELMDFEFQYAKLLKFEVDSRVAHWKQGHKTGPGNAPSDEKQARVERRNSFVRQYMDRLGWSIHDFHNFTGPDGKTMERYLNGDRVQARTLKGIADALNTGLKDFRGFKVIDPADVPK